LTGGATPKKIVPIVEDAPLFGPDLLVIDISEHSKEISRNWGFILLSGVVNFAAGAWALVCPVYATALATASMAIVLCGVGLFSVIGTFYVERGYKLQSLVMGAIMIVLGGLIESDPIQAVAASSLGISAAVFVDGLYRVILAAQNRKLKGWWSLLASGFASIAASIYSVRFLPKAMPYIPGLALGVNLVSVGISRFMVAMAGRELANAYMDI